MATSAEQRARYLALRFAPEHRHLPIVLAELGWRTGRPTEVQRLPRVFFRELDGTRWEIKRSPQGHWRVRYAYDRLIYSVGWVIQYNWLPGAPVFENPAAAALWFDRIGTVLLKQGLVWRENADHVRG